MCLNIRLEIKGALHCWGTPARHLSEVILYCVSFHYWKKHQFSPLAFLHCKEDSWTQKRGTDKDRIDFSQQQPPRWRGLSLDLQLHICFFPPFSLSLPLSLLSSKGKLSLRKHQSPALRVPKPASSPDALSLHLLARLKRSPPSFPILTFTGELNCNRSFFIINYK